MVSVGEKNSNSEGEKYAHHRASFLEGGTLKEPNSFSNVIFGSKSPQYSDVNFKLVRVHIF